MKKNILTFCGVLFMMTLLLSFQSCESQNSDNVSPPKTPQNTITVTKDIAYRRGNSNSWELDLAMPENFGGELRPAIVLIHGGGWAAGSKSDVVFQQMMIYYAKKGYVTMSVEYRLTGEAPFPACIEDVKCAVRWLRANAKDLRVDPNRIGAYGHSAGAHLALMLAMTPKNTELDGDSEWKEYSSAVAVAAAGSPPTELGRDIPMANPIWWPIGYIGANNPPMFLIQGTTDNLVLPERTRDFVTKMKASGADIKYLEVEGGHGIAYDEKLEIIVPAMESFFAEHLHPKK